MNCERDGITLPSDSDWPAAMNERGRIAGQDRLGGFAFALDPSVPYIATAIHAGHRVREELQPLMAIDEAGRYFEEDPETDTMIRGAAAAVWGLDSRSEYDLNRPQQDALPLTPAQFWGTRVYAQPPTEKMNRASLAKYERFYAFMGTWVRAALSRFGVCLVYDIHAYNITRQMQKGVAAPPVFNLGSAAIDRRRWARAIDSWLERLAEISLPGLPISVAENDVFFGKGELCRRLTAWDPRILVLPTEVAKIYMDETSGRVDAAVVDALRDGLKGTMQAHSHDFLGHYG